MPKPFIKHSKGYYYLKKILSSKKEEDEVKDLVYNEEKDRWEVKERKPNDK